MSKTYTAKYTDGTIIYQNKESGNLFGELPLGAMPIKEYKKEISTLVISKKGRWDPWKKAFFKTGSGRTIIVERD